MKIEDLIKAAQSEPIQEHEVPSVRLFLLALGIEVGRQRIYSHQLYRIYKLWTSHPLTEHQFFQELGSYFKSTTAPLPGRKSYYKLNQTPLELDWKARKRNS